MTTVYRIDKEEKEPEMQVAGAGTGAGERNEREGVHLWREMVCLKGQTPLNENESRRNELHSKRTQTNETESNSNDTTTERRQQYGSMDGGQGATGFTDSTFPRRSPTNERSHYILLPPH